MDRYVTLNLLVLRRHRSMYLCTNLRNELLFPPFPFHVTKDVSFARNVETWTGLVVADLFFISFSRRPMQGL